MARFALAGQAWLAACGPAAPPEAPAPQPVARSTQKGRAALGREWFALYCAPCHGLDARGDGPVSPSLRSAPADLTRIAERYGRFDRDQVLAYVDGRERVVPHGTSAMPVWGGAIPDRFGRPGVSEPMLPPEVVDAILEYLRAVQTRQES